MAIYSIQHTYLMANTFGFVCLVFLFTEKQELEEGIKKEEDEDNKEPSWDEDTKEVSYQELDS